MVRRMAEQRRDDVILEYPNREKASSKMTKFVVVVLTLASAALMTVVTIGGWDALQGAKLVQVAYILVYLLVAFYIARWRSGMLPVIAALAIIMLIFAAVSAPEWFSRDKDGFDDPALPAGVLGMLTVFIVPLQVLLIGFAMSGFRQNWHVEVERRASRGRRDDYDDDYDDRRDPAPAPA
jgi:prepilin signal peptidase PulO-like enzyme (type II secretory pathway)